MEGACVPRGVRCAWQAARSSEWRTEAPYRRLRKERLELGGERRDVVEARERLHLRVQNLLRG
jgi:hypothetical protein